MLRARCVGFSGTVGAIGLVVALLLVLLVPPTRVGASSPTVVPGTACPVFPADNAWNTNISGLPVNSDSATWLASMNSATTHLHPDFGPSGDPTNPYGIPYTVVSPTHLLTSIAFQYADESDPGPYPFGLDTPIEGGPLAGGDRHALMVNPATCTLYELWDAQYSPAGSTAGSGAIWSLDSDALRQAGWTSADAAGLPILPGLVNYDEVRSGVMDHAIRFTADCTQESYLWPARHEAGQADTACPPMGARFRLNASFTLPLSSCDALCQTVVTTMKTYGLILADNGSNWFFQGTADTRWSDTDIEQLKQIPAADFQAVDESCLMVNADSGQAVQPGTAAYQQGCPGELEITSDASTTATVGAPLSFTVTTGGSPSPVLTESGNLPAGVNFTDNGNGTATLAGSPTSLGEGSYPLVLTASNGTDPRAVQQFTLVVAGTPTVTSVGPSLGPGNGGTPITIEGTGFLGAVSVSVGGNPVESMAVTSPTSIEATTPAGSVGPADLAVSTPGGVGTLSGAFTYLLADCNPPNVTSGATATASAGQVFSFTVTTCSAATPVIKGVRLPPGLHLINNGDGTATISGTPSARDAGVYAAAVIVSVKGEPATTQSLLVTVDNAAQFRSKALDVVHTGTAFSYTVTTAYGYPVPSIATASALPRGVILIDDANGKTVLTGTPGPQAGGVYPLSISADNGVGSPVIQEFVLTVYQSPQFTNSPGDSTGAGVAISPFAVTTSGYPAARLSATGLPSGIQLTNNLNGTGTIAGATKATAAGTYAVMLHASSKAGTATQSFTLTVNP